MKWVNVRRAPFITLAILIGACILAHNRALVWLEMVGTPLPAMKPTAVARLRFIDYVDTHLWIVLPYLGAWIGALLWLQIRESPRWSLRLTFILLALPAFGYIWICFRAITTPLFWM